MTRGYNSAKAFAQASKRMRPSDPVASNDPLVRTHAQLEREVADLRRQLTTLILQTPHLNPSEAQQDLNSEASYRALIELSPQIVWISDPNGFTTYTNQYWFDLTGLTLEQTINGGWTHVLHPDDAESTYQ